MGLLTVENHNLTTEIYGNSVKFRAISLAIVQVSVMFNLTFPNTYMYCFYLKTCCNLDCVLFFKDQSDGPLGGVCVDWGRVVCIVCTAALLGEILSMDCSPDSFPSLW